MATIPTGTQAKTYTVTTPDTYVLAAGTILTQTTTTALQATVTTGFTTIDIEGTLIDTASGARAIRANVAAGQLIVGAQGVVQARDGDAVQAQAANARFDVNNAGQIISATSITTVTATGATPPGAAYALNFNAAVGAANAPATDFTSGGVITNGSTTNTAALIRSDSGDAIRMGAHQMLVNYGRIAGTGPVNDSSSNNVYGGTSTAQRYDISRGVRINATTATNDTVQNYGVIEGSQHGVDVGNTAASNIVINNAAGATILGHNGSGVGADTTGVAATTVVVTNSGIIRGEYAPTFDRAGLATVDGDGDGVDVDGGATIVNLAGGVIAGSGVNGALGGQGAGGFDSNGRANRSEGLSLGGGSVTNDGLISGADSAIVVNNDSNADGSRSGVLATTITNNASGTIIGQNGYAIRLENKTGSAATDDDTIVNHGTITGNGTIPAGTVLRQDGTADAGTVGTLNGVTYTAADAGSARFIAGDGAAIQTGEGADTLSNYGTITGNTGRAISLEGGNDTLNLYTGSVVTGRIDGGTGADMLNLLAASGTGTGSLADVIGFEMLAVQAGAWTVTDGQAYASGTTVAAGATLTLGGAAGALSGAVVTNGVFAVGRGGSITLSDTITGTGLVVQDGTGTLTLSGANSYSGGTRITAGTLVLAAAGAAGSGAITFASGAGANTVLAIAQGALPANSIAGFAAGTAIDLRGIGLATTAVLGAGNTLSVSGGTGGTVALQFDPGQSFAGQFFSVADDGAGGTLVTVQADTLAIAGTAANQATTDTASIQPFAGLTLSGNNGAATQTATVALSAANGTLSNLGNGTLSPDGLSYSVSGTLAAVQAALRALVFTPTANQVAPGGTVTTGFTVTVADGTVMRTDTTTSVVASSVNHAPVPVLSAVSGAANVSDHVLSGTLGAADAGLAVVVRDGTTVLGTVQTDAQGRFSLPFTYTGTGTGHSYALTATAVDAAGNTGVSAPLAFTLDFTANTPLFGTVVHDPDSAAGRVYAFYDGLLGRAPDGAGLEGWTALVDRGLPLRDLADAFLVSPEFQAGYGGSAASGTDDAFLRYLYQTALGRSSDAAGEASWSGFLASGGSRTDVAVGFAISAENEDQIAPAFQSGVFTVDVVRAKVARLYWAVLGQAPSAGGLADSAAAVQGGASLTDVAQQLLASPEYAAGHAAVPSNAEFVAELYGNALGRGLTPADTQAWVAPLDAGVLTRADVAYGIGESPEAVFHGLAGKVENGLQLHS